MSNEPSTTEELRAEVEKLREELRDARAINAMLMDNNPDGVCIARGFGEIQTNATGQTIVLGLAPTETPADDWRTDLGFFSDAGHTPVAMDEVPLARAMIKREVIRDEEIFLRTPGNPDGQWLSVSAAPLSDGGAISIFRDVTQRKRLEEDLARRNAELAARAQENQQLIERLRVAIDELSTPVLELWDDVLALPVVGVVDTQRSAQMVEKLLQEVVERRSRFVIVDLTGVDVIDTSTADRFLKMARAVKLLGGECVITGIQPAVAQTLVELGVEFTGLDTQRNLKRALQSCMTRLERYEGAAGHRASGFANGSGVRSDAPRSRG